jgi:NADPH-dependent ferric siderophore reductase
MILLLPRLLLPRAATHARPSAETAEAKPLGTIKNALLKFQTLQATVVDVHQPADRFRLITLEGEALKNTQWRPGQKIQLRLGGFKARTYTPVLWDRVEGVTQILTYLHYQMVATTPGTIWAGSARVGDRCSLSAPRESLNLPALQRPAFFFGDETSIGLARSLKTTSGGFDGISFVLEASSPVESRKVLDTLNMPTISLVGRTRDDAHLSQVEALMLQTLQADASSQFVLTGKARSVQRLTQFLKAHQVPPSQIHSRAYWTPGKTGLD